MARHTLHRIALTARRHYRRVFLVAGVLMAASLALSTRLRFDSDFLNLLPQDEPTVQTFRRTLEEFGSVDYLLITVEVPEEVILAPYETLVDRIGGRLEESDLLERVEYKVGDLEELLATFMPQAMLFLDPDGRAAVEAKVGDEALAVRAQEIRRLLATPQALALKRLVRLDPLGLSEVFLDRLGTARVGLSLDWSSGYLLSGDHRMFLLLGKPVKPPQDIDFNKELKRSVEAVIGAERAHWEDWVGPDPPPFPEIALGGRYVIALGDEALIRRDAITNFASSFLGVLLLFLFAFRRWGLLLYAFFPLACGLVVSFGVAALAFDTLSPATSGVAALLIGLGIDFIIVSYGRFVEERHAGVGFEDALARMSGSSGRAVVVGAVTSAATFYAFGFTEFRGLSQMGYLTGTGILLCMVAVLFLLPALLSWSHDRHARGKSDPRLVLHGLGSSWLIRRSMRHPVATLVLGGSITAAAAVAAGGLHFEDSVASMRPKGNEGVAVWDEVAERFGSGFEQMSLVITAPTPAEVLELADRAATGAQRLVAEGVLVDYDGLTRIIPPPSQQRPALEWLKTGRRGLLDPERVIPRFREMLLEAGLRPDAFAEGLDLYREAVSRHQPIGVEDFEASSQARRLLARYLLKLPGDGGWRGAVYLYPPGRIWKREPPPAAVELARSLGPRVELTGANVVSRFLRGRVLRDAQVAGMTGFLLVGLLLWLDFHNLRDTILSLAPLSIGIVWMLGGMVLLGQSMNFMNIFVTTMIIGIGVDYGIHIVHRYRETAAVAGPQRAEGLVETGKAIVLAALSTVVGFGSLSFSHYPGLQSMGRVAILGAMSTAVVATTMLPAYLALRMRRAHRGASDV